VEPCPPFALTPAFRDAGVDVHDVTASFTASTVFPARTLDPQRTAGAATLDLAVVAYDAVNCFGGEDCDNAANTGVQWEYPTVGFSTFGTATRYAFMIRVFKRAIDTHFPPPGGTDRVALKHALVRWAVTHELGHAVGVTRHSDNKRDLMYRHATPEGLDGRFLDNVDLIRIHNRGIE
jgi:hypothetical protein